MTSKTFTLFGGSGFIGRYAVRALCQRGYRVRVATRRPHIAGDLRVAGTPGQVQLTQANVRNRDSVMRAVEGADGVVNLVGILFQAGPQSFSSVQAEGAQLIAEESARAGVDRLVHLSAIGADADSEALYARTKAEGEAAVFAAFPDATVLRPSIVFGPEDQFFNRFANMFRYTPIIAPGLIGGGKTKFQPVFVGDVAAAIVSALEMNGVAGEVYELGGPRVYTLKELFALILRETDRKRWLAPLPWPIASAMGVAGQALGRLPLVEPFLTVDQVKLMRRDNVVGQGGDVGTLADLGVAPETVEAIVPTYLYRYRKAGQFHENAA